MKLLSVRNDLKLKPKKNDQTIKHCQDEAGHRSTYNEAAASCERTIMFYSFPKHVLDFNSDCVANMRNKVRK